MTYTLTQAAKATGKSRSTVLRAIRSGRVSATRDEVTGGWMSEPSELHRLYELVAVDGGRDPDHDMSRNNGGTRGWTLRSGSYEPALRLPRRDLPIRTT